MLWGQNSVPATDLFRKNEAVTRSQTVPATCPRYMSLKHVLSCVLALRLLRTKSSKTLFSKERIKQIKTHILDLQTSLRIFGMIKEALRRSAF